jgi:hypothetical protein
VRIEGLRFKHGAAQLRHALAQPARGARALKEEQLKCTTTRAEALARGEDPDELLPQSEKEIEQGKSPRLKYLLRPLGKAVKGESP